MVMQIKGFAVLRDLHIDADNDDEREVCSWCDCHIADDEGITFCGRRGAQMHTDCHHETGCRCPA